MVATIRQWTLDVQDVQLMARFWSAALGYVTELGEDGNATLLPPEGCAPQLPTVWLQACAGPKREKLRAHLDLRPADGDVEAEIERLLALGARHADVGQTGTEGFVVLADPEGNEFCVLHGDPLRKRRT